MNIDYLKPLIDEGPNGALCQPNYRYCTKCGQRYLIYTNPNFSAITYFAKFNNGIVCPTCKAHNCSSPYININLFSRN